MQTQTKDPNLIIMINDDKECYLFLYHNEDCAEILKTLDRFASNPELNFTPDDAKTLKKGIQKKMEKQEQGGEIWNVCL